MTAGRAIRSGLGDFNFFTESRIGMTEAGVRGTVRDVALFLPLADSFITPIGVAPHLILCLSPKSNHIETYYRETLT